MTSTHFFKRFDCNENAAFLWTIFIPGDIDRQRVAAMADYCNQMVPANEPQPVPPPVASGDGQV